MLLQGEWVTEYYEKIQSLAKKISEWSVARRVEGKKVYSVCTVRPILRLCILLRDSALRQTTHWPSSLNEYYT